MVFPLYFALTAADFHLCDPLPGNCAWLSCHFSSYGAGLTNIPQNLPKGSMLIIDDSNPIGGHDPEQVVRQVNAFLSSSPADSVLLDFQRQPTPEALTMAKALAALPCPVGVSEPYVGALDCPVFLPPPPLHVPLSTYVSPWQSREIWLEAALGQESVCITADGLSHAESCPESENPMHYSQELACHYQIVPEENAVRLILHRTRDDLNDLLKIAESLGIRKAIGLYQELQ